MGVCGVDHSVIALLLLPTCPAEQVASMEAFSSLHPHLFSLPINQNNRPLRLLPNKKSLPPMLRQRS